MLGRMLRRWLGGKPQTPAVTPEQWAAVEATLPCLGHLDEAGRQRLRELALAFLAEKQFHGANGLELTDAMLLSIALQACLPVLKLGLSAYRGWVGVVVYPGDFVVPRRQTDEAGVVHEYDDSVLGEAWEGGPVLLSWFEEPDGAGGANVVIHEFAHKLDMLNGAVDGLPPLAGGLSPQDWAEGMEAAYEALCRLVDRGLPTFLDPYAAQDPGEFFAVASEAFFQEPQGLLAAHPQVYRLLAGYYRQDPAGGGA
jgi:Mlc titration factor MtfA (ptsG expression regulator)